jgi:hypothetical protein
MKNIKFSLKGFLVNCILAALTFSLMAPKTGPVVAAIVAVLFLALAVAKPWLPMIGLGISSLAGGNVHAAGISQEIWEKHIEENLFKDNEFFMGMTDSSEYVNFKTVHNPNAGGVPSVTKNRSLGGAPTNTNLRTDVTVDWNIDEYTSDPFLITNAEEVELSYNKRESVLYEMEMALREVIADNCLINIAPTGAAVLPANMGGTTNNNILRSTGITNNDPADVRAAVAYLPGATGNRLTFTLYDIRQAKLYLDKTRVPKEDRYMLMSPDAEQQLINDLIATKYRASLGDVFDTKAGTVSSLLGFKLYNRSTVCVYDNTATPVVKAYGAAAAATDNDAILFWQKAYVEQAKGDIRVFETLNSAINYGDVYSALIRFGASKRRTSELGIGAIVQAASV